MAGNPITKQIAGKALKKLQAEDITPKGAAHPRYGIYYQGRIVASTGLRHSSKRDILTPHVKKDLRVSAGFVLDLARCPKSREDYLRAIDVLLPEEQENESEAPPSE